MQSTLKPWIKKNKNPNIVILLPIFYGWKHDLKKGMSKWSSCPSVLFAINFLLWIFLHILTFVSSISVCFQVPTLTCTWSNPSCTATVTRKTKFTWQEMYHIHYINIFSLWNQLNYINTIVVFETSLPRNS